ncbi:organic cation transporter protein [Orussus abietinus]|uniref:organic cation transporter protein n=1 Tax=Orussus abietinus TaxID=222816 RepID=UPI0006265AD0|nr:organic cation transporter protein [Orussus abietinus]
MTIESRNGEDGKKESKTPADSSISIASTDAETAHESPALRGTPPSTPKDGANFEKALLHYGSRKGFVVGLFLLCASPGILNGFHVMVYVFYGHTPKHWCSVRILEEAGWSASEVRNVSSPTPDEWSNCAYYVRNYEFLRDLGYDEAMLRIKREKEPERVLCKRFNYEMEERGTSVVAEWDLVCERLALKATVQTAVSIGKFLGAFWFGFLADKYGRKTSFTLASCICIIAGPIVAFASLYYIVVVARVCLGVAGLGLFESAFSIVSEICPPNLRSTLGVLYNQSYPLGIVGVAIIGYYVRDWRRLQLCISLPALLLVFHIFLIPESPRWLYYSGRKARAWKIVGKIRKFLPVQRVSSTSLPQTVVDENATTSADVNVDEVEISNRTAFVISWFEKLKVTVSDNLAFLEDRHFRQRLFVCWVIWCFTAMSYYSLTINADLLHTDPYLYNQKTARRCSDSTFLPGLIEAIGYILVVPILRLVGRRAAASTLLLVASGTLFVLLVIPPDMTICTLITALAGRLCVSGVFSIVIIHAFELFPTVTRNTAIGTSSTMAHFGSIFAPYLVDFFVIYGWWVPSTICGLALLIAGLVAQTLPETKDLPLYNTMRDLTTRCRSNRKERVNLGNCLPCYLYALYKTRIDIPSTQQRSVSSASSNVYI